MDDTVSVDAAAATVLARAAERSYREGTTVRLERETTDGGISYRMSDETLGAGQENGS